MLVIWDYLKRVKEQFMIIGFRSSRKKWYAIDTINNIGIIYKRIGASNNVTTNQLRQKDNTRY